MKYKKGVSLIVLVITIMVIIVLAGAVLLTIDQNNPMVKAKEAVYKQDLRSFAEQLAANNIDGMIDGSLSEVTIKEYNAIKKYIPCFTDLYKDEIVIYEGEVAMVKTASEEHKRFAREVGIKVLGEQEQIPDPKPDPDPIPDPANIPTITFSKFGALKNGAIVEKSDFIRQMFIQFVVEFKNANNSTLSINLTKDSVIFNGFTGVVDSITKYDNSTNKFLVTITKIDTAKGSEGLKTISIAKDVATSKTGEKNVMTKTGEFNLIAPNYSRPPMPNGFTEVSGEWWNAYTIQDKNGNEFVWVPSASIKNELGIQGNISTTTKDKTFGLRAWKNYYDGITFKEDGAYGFSASTNRDWSMTFIGNNNQKMTYSDITGSVDYYGGYYFARYEAGRGANDTPTSKKGMDAWVNIPAGADVKNAAESMDTKNGWPTTGDCVASSILPYGSHYDTYFAWLVDFRGVNRAAIEANSGAWGNYKKYDDNGNPYNNQGTGVIQKTGSNDAVYGKNGMSDLAGNVWEYTTEKDSGGYRVLRGGSFRSIHTGDTAACRYSNNIATDHYGFRTALYLTYSK